MHHMNGRHDGDVAEASGSVADIGCACQVRVDDVHSVGACQLAQLEDRLGRADAVHQDLGVGNTGLCQTTRQPIARWADRKDLMPASFQPGGKHDHHAGGAGRAAARYDLDDIHGAPLMEASPAFRSYSSSRRTVLYTEPYQELLPTEPSRSSTDRSRGA